MSTRRLPPILALVAILLAGAASDARAQLELITGRGLTFISVPTNCFRVDAQHQPGPSWPAAFNSWDWPSPTVVFSPANGSMWIATNTIADWARMFSSNPAILQVPTSVHLPTEEVYNHVTTAHFTTTNVARVPTPVTITAESTKNRGRRMSYDVVVYPPFHIDSVYFSKQQAYYQDRGRVSLIVQLPWALPSYVSPFQAVLHRPSFEWRGQRYEMDLAEWGGEETLVIDQKDGERRIQKMFQLVMPTPEFEDPVHRILWRRQRDIEVTMDVELRDHSSACELVKGDGRVTHRFTMRNPAYRQRGGEDR